MPRAVLYFTGEALEEDSDFEEEESDEDDDDDDDGKLGFSPGNLYDFLLFDQF